MRDTLKKSHLSIRKVARCVETSKSQVERLIGDPEANIGVDTLIKFAAVVGHRIEINLK